MPITSANQLELLQTAEAVAREKMIDPELVIQAMEDSLARAAKSRYGADMDIRVRMDRKTGRATFTRVRTVVEEGKVDNPRSQFTPEQARPYFAPPAPGREEFWVRIGKRIDPKAHPEGPQPGDEFHEVIPPVELGRIAAQSAKQVILQRVREAERERQYEEFKDRVGTIINGTVRREEFGNIIVDIGRGEGVLRKADRIPRESWRPGDRIRAYIKEVRREPRGPQVFLSRTAPEFMIALFKMEVPEVYDGIVEIKACARDPGSRAKIAVISHDTSIDPVGACVGMRGSRVQAVVNELQGEKIDIIPWSPDPATFLVNALQPAEVSKVVIDEETGRIEVVVPDDQLSKAIGRRGQNVRLASQLTGLDIDIITESEESQRRQAEFSERTKFFMEELDLDEILAQLLVTEGFTSLEEVAYVELDELLAIEGLDEETAQELQARARERLEARAEAARENARKLGADNSLLSFEGLSPQMLEALAKAGIRTLEDFATLADWELVGGWTVENGQRKKDKGILEDFDLSLEEARRLIMSARVLLGWVEPEVLNPTGHDENDETGAAEKTGVSSDAALETAGAVSQRG